MVNSELTVDMRTSEACISVGSPPKGYPGLSQHHDPVTLQGSEDIKLVVECWVV